VFAEGVADVAGEPLGLAEGAALGGVGLLAFLLLRLGLAPGIRRGVDVDDAHPGTLRGGGAEGGHARLLRAREVEHEDVVRGVHEVHRAPLEQPAVRVELRLAGERHQHAFATLERRGSGRVHHPRACGVATGARGKRVRSARFLREEATARRRVSGLATRYSPTVSSRSELVVVFVAGSTRKV
jgi:hypothetical protein